MAASPPSSSPPLEGYNTAGEEVSGSSSSEATVASPQPVKRSVKRLNKRAARVRSASDPCRDARGRFTSRSTLRLERLGGNGGNLDSATNLLSVDSLVWDAHAPPLNDTAGTRRWSVETQYDVPIDTVDELDQLSVLPEGRESAASGNNTQQSANIEVSISPELAMDSVDAHRDRLERALIEIEEYILPFMDRQLTAGCVNQLSSKAAELKKILQDGHLYLTSNDREEYLANLKDSVVENRRSLSTFIVSMEEMRLVHEKEAASASAAARAAAQQDAANENAAGHTRISGARQDLVRGRSSRLLGEVASLQTVCKLFCEAKPTSDEQHKVLCGRLDTAIDECKVMAVQALDYDLIKAGEAMDEAVTGLRGLKQMADQSMLDRRKAAGVWTEKGRRSAGRGDLKMPTFSGSSSDRITVYEFEKEWTSYKSAVNFTVEEALKELKVAVQAPARQAVDKLG